MPGSDRGPVKRGAGMSMMQFRAGQGRSSAVLRVDAKARYTLFVGVTDVGGGAKTTMGMIAAEELGAPVAVEVVWGDTDRCPYSVANPAATDDHDRLCRRAGRPRAQDANRRQGDADRNERSCSVGRSNRTPTARFATASARTLSRSMSIRSSARCASPRTSRFTSRGAS